MPEIPKDQVAESRPEARQNGKRFYTGKPCQVDSDHVRDSDGTSIRYAANGQCWGCRWLQTRTRDNRAERKAAMASNRTAFKRALREEPDLFGDLTAPQRPRKPQRRATTPHTAPDRATAVEEGDRFYESDTACPNGEAHLTAGGTWVRFTSNRACVDCVKAAKAKKR